LLNQNFFNSPNKTQNISKDISVKERRDLPD
jgi:hypothetical protein